MEKFKVNEEEYFTLCTFEYKKNNYIAYTDFQKDEEGNVNIYFSMYTFNKNKLNLIEITDKDDKIVIANYLRQLENK